MRGGIGWLLRGVIGLWLSSERMELGDPTLARCGWGDYGFCSWVKSASRRTTCETRCNSHN